MTATVYHNYQVGKLYRTTDVVVRGNIPKGAVVIYLGKAAEGDLKILWEDKILGVYEGNAKAYLEGPL